LSLPEDAFRPLLIAVTYAVVVFSLLVQGTTLARLVRR
jgi:NhaP-type Na+/H+ or K+/H+ antiporter